MTTDPTRVREQPSLTTSTGAIWLIVGGLFTAISLGVLIPMTALPPIGLALIAAIVVALLYIAMVLCGMLVRDAHRRNLAFAWLMSAIAVAAVLALGAVMLGELG